MDRGEIWHLPKTKHSGIEADDKEGCLRVISGADNAGAGLIEVMPGDDTPSSVGDGMVDSRSGG